MMYTGNLYEEEYFDCKIALRIYLFLSNYQL